MASSRAFVLRLFCVFALIVFVRLSEVKNGFQNPILRRWELLIVNVVDSVASPWVVASAGIGSDVSRWTACACEGAMRG